MAAVAVPDAEPPPVLPTREMTRIMVMSDVVLPLAEIKKRLSEIVDGVEGRHDRVVLTRRGRPAAVLISPDELESLEETLALLSDPDAMREIRQAEAAVDAGEVVTADELRRRYLDR
jgi:antitoxin YefM